MKPFKNKQTEYKECFHKICVVGGGLTGAIMTLLLKNSGLFQKGEIAWIKPKEKKLSDLRTTLYNSKSIDLLKNSGLLKSLKQDDYTNVRQISVFGARGSLPLIWDSSDLTDPLGIIIKNEVVLNAINEKLNDIIHYDGVITNTTINNFERTLYLNNKKNIKTHLLLSADGKNSYIRKLLSINTINKNTKHIAISGFLKQSRKHNGTALQAFTELGPIGILPFENDNIVNFVQSIEKNKLQNLLYKNNLEEYVCNNLNEFFLEYDLSFKSIKNINGIKNKLSTWDLDLNLVINPTAERTILIGDAAHSIHPLAGQGLNLALRDCVSVIKAIQKSSEFGNDLGDQAIIDFYKKDRLPQTLSMTAFTDFLFYGFTSRSAKTKKILNKGMENLNKSNLKNIFKVFASI